MSTLPETPNYYQQQYGVKETNTPTLFPLIRNSTTKNKQVHTNAIFTILSLLILFVGGIILVDFVIRKRLWKSVVSGIKKMNINTVLLVMILLTLLVFIVLPKIYK